MAYSVTATLSQEQKKTQGIYPIEMYILNASLTGVDYQYYINLNQNTVGYALDTSGDLTSATVLYTALPIKRDAFANNTQGEITSVSITVPNVDKSIESLIQANNYLRGCQAFVVSMFAKHMPSDSGTNTANYIGIESDYRSHLKEKFYIDSVTSTDEVVTFVCKSKFDIKHIIIPNRTFSPECGWARKGDYLGSECDPTGAINTASFPTCDGSLIDCRARENIPRYGGFTSIPVRGVVV